MRRTTLRKVCRVWCQSRGVRCAAAGNNVDLPPIEVPRFNLCGTAPGYVSSLAYYYHYCYYSLHTYYVVLNDKMRTSHTVHRRVVFIYPSTRRSGLSFTERYGLIMSSYSVFMLIWYVKQKPLLFPLKQTCHSAEMLRNVTNEYIAAYHRNTQTSAQSTKIAMKPFETGQLNQMSPK